MECVLAGEMLQRSRLEFLGEVHPREVLLAGEGHGRFLGSFMKAFLVMGAKAIAKYRHSRYQILRISVIMFTQLGFAYLLPAVFAKLNQPEVYLSYLWPLAYDKLFPGTMNQFLEAGNIGFFIIGWFVVGTLIATPVLTYYYGKRWYCSWVCGCGGLANTAGDSFRQNSDKSLKSWKIERCLIHSVLVWIVVLTTLLWSESVMPEVLKGPMYLFRQ